MSIDNLHKAKSEKNDEFYTLMSDVENELNNYKNYFRDKIVYCNCDSKLSNFYIYFKNNFDELGLKKLIISNYNIEDGSGDFRSEESIGLLKECDIVVTNPPFSLFREYVAQLDEYKKSFLIIGSLNAISYTECFKMIIQNNMFTGYTYPKSFIKQDGTIKKFGNINWYTNLHEYRKNDNIILTKYYNENEYKKYDNYDAINVDKVKDIPCDYYENMGVPIILKDRKPNQWYVEPFVGGCNIIDKVDGNRIANDKNKYLIAMWKGLQENRVRHYDIPKDLYNAARNEYNSGIYDEFDEFHIGWIGWMGSFNGRFFDGGYSGKTKTRDYVSEQIRNTEKQIPLIKDIIFKNFDYDKLIIPIDSIIYCDIPYQGTKQYSTSKGFDYDKFWEWCRNKTKDGHAVYISEYNAPSDFECIWSKEVVNSMNTSNTYKPIEKLFKYGN